MVQVIRAMETCDLCIDERIKLRKNFDFHKSLAAIVIIRRGVEVGCEPMAVGMDLPHCLSVSSAQEIVERRTEQHKIGRLYCEFMLQTSRFQRGLQAQIDIVPEHHERLLLSQAIADLFIMPKGITSIFKGRKKPM